MMISWWWSFYRRLIVVLSFKLREGVDHFAENDVEDGPVEADQDDHQHAKGKEEVVNHRAVAELQK